MEPNVFDKVHDVDLKKTMEQSYMRQDRWGYHG